MHMTIGVLVETKNEKEALACAETVMERLCENQYPFDYYNILEHQDPQNAIDFITDGQAKEFKWTDVCTADSALGKIEIKALMEYTKSNFMGNLKKVKEVLAKFSDKEIYNEDSKNRTERDDLNFFKYLCSCLGQYSGSEIHLYDRGGVGIRCPEMLERNLTISGKENETQVFIVCADVHF